MQKWHTDKWFTSEWNFLDSVRKHVHLKDNIKLHDVTLRDGEQQSGILLTSDEKIALAESMAQVGIHRIEAGMPVVCADDERAIREIVKRDLGPEIFGFARCMVDDVKRNADCGVNGIVIEIPSNEEMITQAYGWTLEKAEELSIKASLAAKAAGLYTVFFPIDMTRANMEWVLNLIKRVAAEGHMDALAIVDTLGGLAPHTIPFLVDAVKSNIDKPIELHFHDDFGLGAANSIMGLAAGADVVHTTVSGIGERAGNACYEDIVMALLTMYDYDMGLDYSKIYPLSKQLREYTKLAVRSNRGIVGDGIFQIESGIVAEWYQNAGYKNPLITSPYIPSLTGHPGTQLMLGKHSGIANIEYWLDKYSIRLTNEQKRQLVGNVKLKTYQMGRLLDETDFRQLLREYL